MKKNRQRFLLLVRHFFSRFFDTEALSPNSEAEAGVIQTLGILAVPGAFFVLLFRTLTLWGWPLVSVRYIFVLYSMIVMGFVMVFQWDALFPDRRDYQILTPLPVRLGTLFLAKAAALAIFLGLFLLDINLLGTLFWPGVDGGTNTLQIFWAHLLVVLASGLLSALFFGAIQGVLITLFRGRAYRRVSVTIQTLLMAVLVMLFFVTHALAFGTQRLVRDNSPLLYCFPGFWFIGLYERIRPATRNPLLMSLGTYAIGGLCISALVFLLTYLPGYRRHARQMIESEAPAAGAPRRRWIKLNHPVENAVFHFIAQTIVRSARHRLFLATYGGFGAAVAVLSLGGGGREGLLTVPLTLSFVLVSGLRAAFNFPCELRANWLFQASEIDAVGRYAAGTRKWIVRCAIVPLFLLLAPLEFSCWPWAVALFHLAFGVTLSLVLLEILFAGFRKIPFTCAHFPGKVNFTFLMAIYAFGFTMYSRIMAGLETWLTGEPAAGAGFLLTVWSGLYVAERQRRPASGGVIDYEDAGDPIVRTLDLTLD